MIPDPHYVDTNGIRMAVYEQGVGPAVIFLHGFPELAFSWRHQLPALADAGFHVLVIGREFAVSGLRYVALTEGITISASWLGKGKMTAQVVAISLFLVAPYDPIFGKLAQISLAAVVVLTVISMIDYFRAFWGQVDSLSAARENREGRPELLVVEKRDKREAS